MVEPKNIHVMLNEVEAQSDAKGKHLNAESARCFALLNMTRKRDFVYEVLMTFGFAIIPARSRGGLDGEGPRLGRT